MASSKITQTMTIVDPFDELSDLAAANERVQAGLTILSDRLCDVLYGSLDTASKLRHAQDGWLMLELIRECHTRSVAERVRVAEEAFYERTDALAIHNEVRALRDAA